MDNKISRECSECKKDMIIDTEKYCDVIIWRCPNCGHEIYISNNCC